MFYTFDFEMCFAPQRRALFHHLNFQKCSEPLNFLHFWLRNVLRATTACTFSPSQLPKVVRTLCEIIGKTVFRDFPTFSRTCVFFLLTLSLSLTLPTSAFPSVHTVGSLTSKLPSVILSIWIQNSRFKAQKKLLQSNLFGFKIQGWRPSDSGSFFGILNLESYPLGFKNFLGHLESWILNPMYLGKGGMGSKLQKEMQFLITKKCPEFWSPKWSKSEEKHYKHH